MRYNDALPSEYGLASLLGIKSPVPYKPLPDKNDYSVGQISRTFVKKANENWVMEVNYADSLDINPELYKTVVITWKITGPRSDIYKENAIIENGVEAYNKFEIERVKTEQNIDLTTALPNLLEFWRGY